MTTSPEIDLTASASLEELELVDQLIEFAVEWSDLPAENGSGLTLAVREATANAISHGSPAGAEERIHLTVRFESDALVIVVRDHGDGFDPDDLPDPLAAPNLLKPSGRGILLMRSFMDEVSFDFPEDGGTSVTMRKEVSRGCASTAVSGAD